MFFTKRGSNRAVANIWKALGGIHKRPQSKSGKHPRRLQAERRRRTGRDWQRLPDVVGARTRELPVPSDVRVWHLADITMPFNDVRFRGQNGHAEKQRQCPLMTQSSPATRQANSRMSGRCSDSSQALITVVRKLPNEARVMTNFAIASSLGAS